MCRPCRGYRSKGICNKEFPAPSLPILSLLKRVLRRPTIVSGQETIASHPVLHENEPEVKNHQRSQICVQCSFPIFTTPSRSSTSFMGSSFYDMDSFMGAWEKLCNLGAVCSNLLEGTWQMVINLHKKVQRLLLFSSARHNIMCKGYPVPEFFANNLPSVLQSCFTELGRRATLLHVSLNELFGFVLRTFNRKDALQTKDALHFWNIIIKGIRSRRLQADGHWNRLLVIKKPAADASTGQR